jgi:menaquinone-dependent protoporphyrinogen IX oxidase
MRAVVIHESMFGATKAVAEAVAAGIAPTLECQVVRAAEAGEQCLDGVELVFVGAPPTRTGCRGRARPAVWQRSRQGRSR